MVFFYVRNSKYGKIVSIKERRQYAFANKKSGSFTALNAYDGNIVTNGDVIYYFSEDHHYFYLNRYDCVQHTIRRLKKLGLSTKIKSEPASWYFRYAYRQYIYLTKSSFDDWNYQSYMFNTRNNALSKKLMNGDIIDASGAYVSVQMKYRTDITPYPLKLYKIKSNGRLKTVKTLSQNANGGSFVGTQCYYTAYPKKNSMTDMSIYKINRNGTQKKRIKTFHSASMCLAYDFKKKSCTVYLDGTIYRFTYQTKKLTKA